MHRSLCCVVISSCFALALVIPAFAQDLTFSANPPRVQVSAKTISPLGIPQCGDNDPTLPTPGVIYCYEPPYIWTAYNTLPLYLNGITGAGQTIVIIDAYGTCF